MKNKKLFFLFAVVVVGWLVGQWGVAWYYQKNRLSSFRTDFSKKSIDLNQLIFGTVGKDDIPEIFNPKFISVKDAENQLKDSTKGVLVDILGQQRFYPFNILLWHEVINDFFEGVPYTVTYSPFCESVAVYKGSLQNQGIKFKASGLLYKANLVFYDTKTESLWSQGLGKAIAGEFNNLFLDLVPTTQVLTYKDLKINHYGAQVLSQDTGYFNNYSYNPYSGYLENENIPDFASYENKRFPAKKMMYVVPVKDKSLVFALDDLPDQEVFRREVADSEIRVGKSGSEIIITQDGKRIGGYPQLWFCWSDLHVEDGIVWDIKLEELTKKALEKNNSLEATASVIENSIE